MAFAAMIAWRNDPGPASSVFVTVKVAASSPPETASHNPEEIRARSFTAFNVRLHPREGKQKFPAAPGS